MCKVWVTARQHPGETRPQLHSALCRSMGVGYPYPTLTHDAGAAGEPAPEKRKVWVIARQHPGETMAEFFAEVSAPVFPTPSRV